MDWLVPVTLIGMLPSILGSIWVISNRFERRLDKEIKRLDDKIEGLRTLLIEYIAKK